MKNRIALKTGRGACLAAFAACLAVAGPVVGQTDQDVEAELKQQKAELREEAKALEMRAAELARQLEAGEISDAELQEEVAEIRREALEMAREVRIEAQEVAREVRAAAREASEEMRAWSWVYSSESKSSEPETYFGITAEPVPAVLRDYIDLPKGVGILLPLIAKDSPAEKGGLKNNDILVEVDGQLIVNFSQLSTLIDLKKAGDVIRVKVLRKGQPMEFDVTLEERVRKGGRFIMVPEPPPAPEAPTPPDAPEPPQPGAETGFNIGDWIPGSVNVVVDDQQRVHVDLRDLRENLSLLQDKLAQMNLGDAAEWEDIVRRSGDLASRTTVVLMEEGTISYSGSDGKVSLTTEGAEEHVLVQDADGRILYEGILPDNYADTLDTDATRLIERFMETRRHLDTDLSDGKDIRIEVHTEEDGDKLTMITREHRPVRGA